MLRFLSYQYIYYLEAIKALLEGLKFLFQQPPQSAFGAVLSSFRLGKEEANVDIWKNNKEAEKIMLMLQKKTFELEKLRLKS